MASIEDVIPRPAGPRGHAQVPPSILRPLQGYGSARRDGARGLFRGDSSMFVPVQRASARVVVAIALLGGSAVPAVAAKHPAPSPSAAPAPAEEHILRNGMKLVLVPRHLSPTVAGGWVAHVGSA